MRPGSDKLADKHQICTKGAVTQNKRGRSVALIAPTQQVLSRALRQIEFATQPVITRLPIERLNELWGRSQPFPQLASATKCVPGFLCSRRYQNLINRP